MKPVALLCPGPSLREVWTEDLFDQFAVVVAMNTAGFFFRHHWLAVQDLPVIKALVEGGHHRPLRGFVVGSEMARDVHAHVPNFAGAFRPLHYTFQPDGDHVQPKYGFTFPNALEFAIRLAPGEVHCYGVDYAIGQDGPHPLPGDDHGPMRFENEAAQVRDVIARFAPGRATRPLANGRPVADYVRFVGRIHPDVSAYLVGARPAYPRELNPPRKVRPVFAGARLRTL